MKFLISVSLLVLSISAVAHAGPGASKMSMIANESCHLMRRIPIQKRLVEVHLAKQRFETQKATKRSKPKVQSPTFSYLQLPQKVEFLDSEHEMFIPSSPTKPLSKVSPDIKKESDPFKKQIKMPSPQFSTHFPLLANSSPFPCFPFMQKRLYSSSNTSENDNQVRKEKMKSLLFIINDAPYGNERAYNALRLAGAVINKNELQVRLFLMADAVGCAKAGQKLPEGYYNIQLMLGKIIRKGEVGLCGTCMDARGLTEAELIEGAKRSTLAQLADWTVEAEKVLIF